MLLLATQAVPQMIQYAHPNLGRLLVDQAHDRSLPVHMGRVTSRRRLVFAHALGCTSADGTGWVRWRATNLPGALATLAELDTSPRGTT